MALIDASAHGWRTASLSRLRPRRPLGRETARANSLMGLALTGHAEWQRLVERLELPSDVALHAAVQANVNGTDFQTELLASRAVSEEAFFRALAMDLDLPFVGQVDPERLIIRSEQSLTLLRRRGGIELVKIEEADGIAYLIAPECTRIGTLQALLKRKPGMRSRLRVTTTSALRAALLKCAEPPLMRIGARDLFERYPEYSARIVVSAWQGMAWGVLLAAFVMAIVFVPDAAYATIHALFSLCFLACIGLRVAAAHAARPPVRLKVVPAAARDLPVYSVLVALYDEAGMVPGLIEALERIEWPRSKLEIKLCCEADDRATLSAIRACALPSYIEVIETPPQGPRTKPKALSYALPVTGGEFVVLFDAEDRPHPMQLMEAWQRFRESGAELACVQAPLEISNRHGSFISRMFFFEYAALFRGLLPWLSRRGLMLPLGGTSNHFRREALEAVGSWDPHNVTEDADLGLRLARFGYRSETISCPTLEEAPEDFGTWLPAHAMVQGLGADLARAYAQSGAAGGRGGAGVVSRRPDIVCRPDPFGDAASAACRDGARRVGRHQGKAAARHLAIRAAAAGYSQHRLRLCVLPAAWLAHAAAARTQGFLEDGAVHPALLADDLAGRLALDMAVVAPPPPLGKDGASPAGGGQGGMKLTRSSSGISLPCR